MNAVEDISGIHQHHHVSIKHSTRAGNHMHEGTSDLTSWEASHLTDAKRQAHLSRPDALVEPTPRLQAIVELLRLP
jgi:hypothetical protein